MKLSTQENFRLAAILLYYIVQKIALTEVECYLRFYYYTSFQAPNLNCSNVALISPVYIFSMLLLTKHLQQWWKPPARLSYVCGPQEFSNM